jgi:hypothetical protein
VIAFHHEDDSGQVLVSRHSATRWTIAALAIAPFPIRLLRAETTAVS